MTTEDFKPILKVVPVIVIVIVFILLYNDMKNDMKVNHASLIQVITVNNKITSSRFDTLEVKVDSTFNMVKFDTDEAE